MMLNLSSNGRCCHSTWGCICYACLVKPSTLYCHNYASCDTAFHGFNPTKLWHERVCAYTPCDHSPAAEKEITDDHKPNEADKYKEEIDSWLSLDPENNDEQSSNHCVTHGEVGEYLDRAECNLCFENHYQVKYGPQQCHSIHLGNTKSESLVPVQFVGVSEKQPDQWRNFNLGMEHEMSEAGIIHNPPRNQAVSVPFMDAGVILEATMSSISESYMRIPERPFGIHSSTALVMPPDFTPTSREAKLLRYREKKKARKFEKTIRYASRKAYAEIRPRVKGKFAREKERELELDQIFSTAEHAHGIVLSF